MKSPAFQFYPTDWLGSQRVQMLTLEEEGAYMRLLCSCWQHGSIPADPAAAARLIGKGASTTLATVVLAMFQPGEPGRMIHDRLEAERTKQAVWREKSAAGGRKSAENRKGASTTVQPPFEGCLQNGANQTPTLRLLSPSSSPYSITSPSHTSKENRPAPSAPAVEESIYIAYPRRQGRADALKAIAKAIKAGNSPLRLLERTQSFAAATALWPESDHSFIPHPATWFNRGSYDDDPETWVRHTPGNNRVGTMTPKDHENGF